MDYFDDDDPIDQAKNQVEDDLDAETFKAKRTSLKIKNRRDAPLTATDFKVLLELTGAETGKDRTGIDIVAVLDISGSMSREERLVNLKIAMRFLIKKLSPLDRLSVVTFSDNADRRSRLMQMTEINQTEIEQLVQGIRAGGNTNITAGLRIASKVLNERSLKDGRRGVIMLMSDGIPNREKNGVVDVGDIPIFTFGLGKGHDSKVLHGIAKNGGVYSVASSVGGENSSSLNTAFATCLAGLLYVVVEDLTLTIEKKKADIKKVSAGDYIPLEDASGSSQIVSFGFLYSGEKRKVMVDLGLPAVMSLEGTDTIEVSYSYRVPGGKRVIPVNPVTVTVSRLTNPVSKEDEEVVMEDAREKTVSKMKEAKDLADRDQLVDAKGKLDEAKKELDDLKRDADELTKALKYEVEEFKRLLKDSDTYKNEGLPFILAALLSHGLQRFAPRGDATKLLKAFAVPLAIAFAEQASKFDKDPNMEVPTIEQDQKQAEEIKATIEEEKVAAKKEIEKTTNPKPDAKDLIAAKADVLSQQLDQVFQALTAIKDVIDSLRSS